MGTEGFDLSVLGRHQPHACPGGSWNRQPATDNVRFPFRDILCGLSYQLPDKGFPVERPISRRTLAPEQGRNLAGILRLVTANAYLLPYHIDITYKRDYRVSS